MDDGVIQSYLARSPWIAGSFDEDQWIRTTYVIHCRNGRRSANSFEIFRNSDFKKIIHMDNSILGWNEGLVK